MYIYIYIRVYIYIPYKSGTIVFIAFRGKTIVGTKRLLEGPTWVLYGTIYMSRAEAQQGSTEFM